MTGRYDIAEHGARGTPHLAQFEGYTVGQWCPTPDGTGQPEAVVISIGFGQKLLLGYEENGEAHVGETDAIGLRLGSRHAINTLIEILERYRDEVFPLEIKT